MHQAQVVKTSAADSASRVTDGVVNLKSAATLGTPRARASSAPVPSTIQRKAVFTVLGPLANIVHDRLARISPRLPNTKTPKANVHPASAPLRQLDQTQEERKQVPDGPSSTTDPDVHSMNSQAKGTGLVGYNGQAAIDAKHCLIVAHWVNNIGNDWAQLTETTLAA